MRFFEPLSLALALAVSYAWVTVPELRGYSLQLTAALLILFFALKQISRSRLHHILPKPESFETAVLVGAVTLGVGFTGGLASPFLPLIHLVLFASVLSLRMSTNIAEMIGLTLFLWAVSDHPLSTNLWLELLTFPFLLPLMIFARFQFDEAKEQKYRADQQESLLREEEKETLTFLGEFLHPKLQQLQRTLSLSPQNIWSVERQIDLLEKESREFLIRTHEEYLLHGKENGQKDVPTS